MSERTEIGGILIIGRFGRTDIRYTSIQQLEIGQISWKIVVGVVVIC